MSQEPQDVDSLSLQIEQIHDLVRSPDWRHWLSFLRTRKVYLQDKVNMFLRGDQEQKAKIALALMNDCDEQIKFFQQRLRDLESKKAEASK